MNNRQRDAESDRALGDHPPDAATDSSALSEGIGGVPDLKPEERATVSDVDGDNVETDRPKPQM